jgi:hypothetical protein
MSVIIGLFKLSKEVIEKKKKKKNKHTDIENSNISLFLFSEQGFEFFKHPVF